MFEVNVNGRKQRYRSKPTMNVDTTGSSGGSISKPLTYDYMPEGYPKKDGWSIEWDGNTEGKTYIPIEEGLGLCKISDFLPTDDELIGAIMELSTGESVKIPSNRIDSSTYPGITVVGDEIYIIRKDNSIADIITFPEKGVYARYGGGVYVKKIKQ